jgi:Leucine-rich repeat (LRR) protein
MEVDWTSIISRYDNLHVLDVSSSNLLTGAHLECLSATVREVDLSSNTTEESDNEPAIVLPYLVRLDISNNQLNKLPSLMEVPALQTLVFSNNQIEELPSDLGT